MVWANIRLNNAWHIVHRGHGILKIDRQTSKGTQKMQKFMRNPLVASVLGNSSAKLHKWQFGYFILRTTSPNLENWAKISKYLNNVSHFVGMSFITVILKWQKNGGLFYLTFIPRHRLNAQNVTWSLFEKRTKNGVQFLAKRLNKCCKLILC